MPAVNHKLHLTRCAVLHTNYTALPRDEILHFLPLQAQKKQPGYVCVWNVHTTMMSFFDSSYARIGNESLFTVPDGMPIVWAMNMLRPPGTKPQDRIRGPSLMRDICALGLDKGFKHYLYGSKPETLELLQKTLRKDYPGIEIVGAESPPFRPLSEAEMQDAAERINKSGAHFVWVGLGAPKQERWMYAQKDRIQAVQMGVGAAFDLIPGVVPEAPEILQNLGLEWLYRLLKEPRRLWRRYLFNNPAFLCLLFWQYVQEKILKKRDFNSF